jgi:hypothetical protein
MSSQKGATFSISIMGIPAFLAAPATISLKQFNTIYQIGKASTPPSCLFTAATFFYLSYCNYPSLSHGIIEPQSRWKRHLGAGVCAAVVLLFTYIVLEKTSQELLRLEKTEGESLKGESEIVVGILLHRWKSLNLVRSGMLAASAIIGFFSILR